jgi:hypothetical protein
MSHNYNLCDIKRAFCGYFGSDLVDYGCGFMSHKMELNVPGECRGREGGMPIFFRGWARDECGKNSDQLVDKGRGKSAASVGAAAARARLLLRFGEME